MLSTLHSKLSAVLLAVFVAFAGFTLLINLVTTRAFLDEVNQKVALTLAESIAADRPLFVADRLNLAAVKAFFSTAMTINPLAEMYLLDTDGRIVASSVPAADIHRRAVDLRPLRAILAGETPPVRADDPRHESRQKVFSVAALSQGYLYIVLGGEQFDSVIRMLLGSQILRWGAWSVGASLLGAVLAGALIFRSLTQPLRRLTGVMERFESEGYRHDAAVTVRPRRWSDEVDRLTTRFDRLSAQLAAHVDRLKFVDVQRRELVANVSHDLKTPLSAVRGYLDTLLIKESTLSDTERRAFVELALGQNQRVDRLVSELLELSRLESGEMPVSPEMISLCDLVQDVVQKFQNAAGARQIVLQSAFDANLPLVRMDVRLIERLLDNLLDNALQHTGPSGTITVGCAAVTEGMRVTVQDSGDGIHPDDLPHIFERFYRGRRASGTLGGAGLGLAISRRIAELHHAELRVANDRDRGATFTLILPVRESPRL